MTVTIALAGKGGTGKTTIAGFLIGYLITKNKKPVLAVDADSNVNLNEVLGLKCDKTLGDAREAMKGGNVPSGMTKNIFIEMKLQESIIESDDFDLIVMGRPEGAGCYCAANTLLSSCLDDLVNNYSYVVIDNEAGMEHISRITTKKIDILLIISDNSARSIQAASRISNLTDELKLEVKDKYLIINRFKGDESELKKLNEEYNLNIIGTLADDKLIQEYDWRGKPTYLIDSKSKEKIYSIFDKIL